MIATSKVTKKNQTTLPRVVVEALGVKPADRIYYEIEDGRIVLRSKTERLADLRGKFKNFGRKPETPVSVEQMHEAVQEAVAEKETGFSGRRRMTKPRKAREA
jgi:bifunctional DNA-binding transcriptional regulator/antitoxin component of YhaV-PrlF toxin-antitoxin module